MLFYEDNILRKKKQKLKYRDTTYHLNDEENNITVQSFGNSFITINNKKMIL